MKTAIIVQARMGSTRLPGKVLKEVLGKPLLGHLLDRLRAVQGVDKIVIATSYDAEDQPIIDFCEKNEVAYFKGAKDDVLLRYYEAARLCTADIIVRITADCPLIDPDVISGALHYMKTHDRSYVSNTINRTYPRGMDFEIFTKQVLGWANEFATDAYDREHVTPYMLGSLCEEDLVDFALDKDYSHYRVTVDEPADYWAVRAVLMELSPKLVTNTADVIGVLQRRPDIVALNSHVEQTKDSI
jgi:spore coat polysaccharide biosynthesis protein SpsF